MSFTEYIEDVIDLKMSEVQLGMIGKIEKFDASKMRADVKPLLKIKNALEEEIELPILIDLPVLFHTGGGFFIKPNYSNGDLVWIGFATHDIEDALNNYSRSASAKMFELHNACVLGGIKKNNAVMPDLLTEDGLTIGHEDGYGIICKDDVIEIGDFGGSNEPAILGDTFTDALNTFLTSVGGLTGGDPGQNAAAITALAVAANIYKAQIETFKSEDVKIT